MRSLDEVAYARRLGLTVIVTDHHRPGNHLPPANVVVNPKHPSGAAGLGELAGVGVAFELCSGVDACEPECAAPHYAARARYR